MKSMQSMKVISHGRTRLENKIVLPPMLVSLIFWTVLMEVDDILDHGGGKHSLKSVHDLTIHQSRYNWDQKVMRKRTPRALYVGLALLSLGIWLAVSTAFSLTQDRNQETNASLGTPLRIATQSPHTTSGEELVVCNLTYLLTLSNTINSFFFLANLTRSILRDAYWVCLFY